MRTRKFPALIALLLAFAALTAGGAAAQSTSETANLDATVTTGVISGTRVLQPVSAVALDTALAGTKISGPFAVNVVETSAIGVASWNVDAHMTALTHDTITDGSAPDIPTTAVTFASTPAPTVASANLTTSVTSSSGLPTGGDFMPNSSDVSAGTAPLNLFTVTGENTSAYYTDTYAFTGTLELTPPNGTVTGTYSSTITVTLTQ